MLSMLAYGLQVHKLRGSSYAFICCAGLVVNYLLFFNSATSIIQCS